MGNPTAENPLSKEAVSRRQPGKENRICPNTQLVRRDCDCWSCRGRRNKNKGTRTQRTARKSLEKAFAKPAGPSARATSQEENWRLPVRTEVKSGRYAEAVGTFYRNTKIQADQAKAIGDTRPFLAVAQVDGMTDGLAVLKLSDLQQLFEEARR